MLVLKRGCRPLLAEPKGERLERPESIGRITICVGDRVTREFWSAGLRPEVCVVDLREERRRVSLEIPPGYTLTTVDNPRGAISPDAWRVVGEAIRSAVGGERRLLIVRGEEDLLCFPAVILAPDGSAVVYGQPGEGMRVIKVNEEERERALSLLDLCFEVTGVADRSPD